MRTLSMPADAEAVTALAAPVLPGLVFRRLRGASDYPALAEIVNASNAADGVEETTSAEQIAHEFSTAADLDPRADVLVSEVDGAPIAYSYVWRLSLNTGEDLYRHRGYLRPEWRRRGIGRALWRWNEARLRQIAAGHPSAGPRYFQVVAEDTALGKTALARQEGYQPVRYFYFMQRQDLAAAPDPALSAGLEFRPARPDEARAIWEAKEAAFAGHWGHSPQTEADYRAWATNPLNDPSLWVIAWEAASGQIAGVALNAINAEDNARYGFRRGWVNSLGVCRPWRGRGLGRAILQESLRRLRGAGMTEAVLGVDAANETGALRLYESAGFRVINQDAVCRKPLT